MHICIIFTVCALVFNGSMGRPFFRHRCNRLQHILTVSLVLLFFLGLWFLFQSLCFLFQGLCFLFLFYSLDWWDNGRLVEFIERCTWDIVILIVLGSRLLLLTLPNFAPHCPTLPHFAHIPLLNMLASPSSSKSSGVGVL